MRETLSRNTLLGHSCATLLWDTLVENSCGTLLRNTFSFGTLLWDTLVGRSCRTLLRDALVGHSCRRHSCGTLLHPPSRQISTTSVSYKTSWHQISKTRASCRMRLPPKIDIKVSKTSASQSLSERTRQAALPSSFAIPRLPRETKFDTSNTHKVQCLPRKVTT